MIRTANPAKYDHIDFKPPKSVADAAEKGLEYRAKANPSDKGGLTPAEASKQGIGSGVQRATNLKNRTNVSPDVIRQMCAFFARHEKNKGIAPENRETPWKDKGYVAWQLWGGDPGKAWAEKVRDQMDRADEKADKTAHSLIDHELVNDLASAYRGKRMRDGIRDMEMAGMPEQVAERFYDTLGQHADEVRGELHRMVEEHADEGCGCGCGADCPCMKQRVASRFASAKVLRGVGYGCVDRRLRRPDPRRCSEVA